MSVGKMHGYKVVIDFDVCDRVFGDVNCGVNVNLNPCYKTTTTCLSANLSGYHDGATQRYTFISNDIAIAEASRPYIKDVVLSPAEIKDSIGVVSRASLKMLDEVDDDIDVDLNYDRRSSFHAVPPESSFWRKFFARHERRWRSTAVKVYSVEYYNGNLSQTQIFEGRMESVKFGRGDVTIECADYLADLSKIDIPAKSKVKVAVDCDDNDTDIDVTSFDGYIDNADGYVRIGDEIIKYGTRNTTGNPITRWYFAGCTRGQFGTTAAAHSAGDAVQWCRKFTGDNLVELAEDVLAVAGITSINGFSDLATAGVGDLPNSEDVLITVPTRASELLYDIVSLLAGVRMWADSAGVIQIKQFLSNSGSYTSITDDDNILEGSASVDQNDKALFTRVSLRWNKSTPVAQDGSETSYKDAHIVINADAEGALGLGKSIDKPLFTRWLQPGANDWDTEVDNYVTELVDDASIQHPILSVRLAFKDEALAVGDFVRVTSDEFLDIYGNPVENWDAFVCKRERKADHIAVSLYMMTFVQH